MTGPTYLTLLRIILAVVSTVFVLLPATWAKITALVIFILAAITDKIDGAWARRSRIVTTLGAFLDPLADKMLVNLTFLALVYLQVVPLWAFAVILVRDFAVDGLRMMLAQSGTVLAASPLGKLKTTVQMTTLITLLLNLVVGNSILTTVNTILLYIVAVVTVISGLDYFIKSAKKLKLSRPPKKR